MAATISSDMDGTDKVVTFLEETRALGIEVLPPDVNASTWMFEAVEPNVVRYGLGAIKGVGHGACIAIAEERDAHGPYRDLADFCRRVDANRLNKRVLEALILSGAMDALGPTRASLMAQLPEAVKAAEQHLRDAVDCQNDMFGNAGPAPASAIEWPTVPEWPLEQRLIGERETLGHYLSGHPTEAWQDVLAQLATCPLNEIAQRYQPPARRGNGEDEGNNRFRRAPETPWTVAGMVAAVRKRGDTTAFVRLEDAGGAIEVSFFREAWTEFSPLLTRDAMLVVEGGLSIDSFTDGYQLRARRACTLGDACERQARLLRIKVNGIGTDFIAALRQAIAAYRGGSTPLLLCGYRNALGQADIELGAEWHVRAQPDLLRALRALPGVLDADLRLAR
jgi:DNA polymerase-3 subunit alpha